MSTQIAATPIIRGSEARKILSESKRKTSEKAQKGAKILSNRFEKMVR